MASTTLLTAMLQAAGVAPCVAGVFVPLLRQACRRFGIGKPAQLAAFVSHCACESRGFVNLQQSLLYRTPERICATWPERVPDPDEADWLIGAPQLLANTVYGGLHGNGDAANGDGWRYRGRGLIRLLGRAAYRQAGAALGRPYEEQPDLVAQPRDACLVAAWLWEQRGLNALADRLQWDAIAHRVRGPRPAALPERRTLYRGALAVLQDMGRQACRVVGRPQPSPQQSGRPGQPGHTGRRGAAAAAPRHAAHLLVMP